MISRLTGKALKTLGKLIQVARRKQSVSQAALAERLGVTRQTIIALEKGDSKVAVGTVFEAAYIVGIPIFSDDKQQLSKWQSILTDFSGLLSQKTRQKKQIISDDF